MKYHLTAFAVCALALSGCNSTTPSAQTPLPLGPSASRPVTPPSKVQLMGPWALTQMAGYKLNAKTTLEIMPDGKITGSGGCNRYFGKAIIKGSTINFGPAGSTRMACAGGGMQQEAAYFNNLKKVQSWNINGNKLMLTDSTGQTIMTFRKQ